MVILCVLRSLNGIDQLRSRIATALGLGLATLSAGLMHAADIEPAPASPAHEAQQQTGPDWTPSTWALSSAADDDVIAPIAFASVDPEETARLRAQAVDEVPHILRFVSSIVDEAIVEFDQRLVESRREFQLAVAAAIGPLPLDAKAFLGGDFEEFRLRWIGNHPTMFPPSLRLARTWATQVDDMSMLQPWREELMSMLAEKRLCETELLAPETGVRSRYLLVSVSTREEGISMEIVALRGSLIEHDQLLTVPQAGALIRRHVSMDEPAAHFVSQLLRPNTFFDADATESARAEAANQAVAPAREYQAGTVIVRKGEVISPRVLAALTDLHAVLSTLPPAQTEPDVTTGIADSTLPSVDSAPTALPTSPVGWINRVFLIGLPIALAAMALAIGWLAFRLPRRSQALVPVGAFKPAEAESPVVLALRDSAVQSLYSQRQVLLTDQDDASEQVAALEARIARLHPQIQSKIHDYETRIDELEARLTAKHGSERGEFGLERSKASEHFDYESHRAVAPQPNGK